MRQMSTTSTQLLFAAWRLNRPADQNVFCRHFYTSMYPAMEEVTLVTQFKRNMGFLVYNWVTKLAA